MQLSMVFTSCQVLRFGMVVLRSWFYGVQDTSVSFKNKAEKKKTFPEQSHIHSFFFLNVADSISMRSF